LQQAYCMMNAKRNWAVARVAFNTATEKDLKMLDDEEKDKKKEKEGEEGEEEEEEVSLKKQNTKKDEVKETKEENDALLINKR